MPAKPSQPNRPSPSYLRSLERRSNKSTHKAGMLRFHWLEWLRLESLALADLSAQERQHHQHDLATVKACEHDWRIDCGPKPQGVIATSGLPLFAQQLLAVFPLPLGHPNRDPNRVVLSLDPLQSLEEVLIPEVKRQVSRALKQRFHRKRAAGGGQPHPLAKMSEALRLYARQKQDVRQQHSRGRSKTPIKCLVEGGKTEDYGKKLLVIARRMIKAAQAGPAAWRKAYPVK